MTTALLGVDIGTTNCKAVAFSLDGAELAKASAATQTIYPRPDWAEFDPKTLWATLVSIIRSVVDRLPDHAHVASVAFTGMAEAGLALDENDEPLYPAITWHDRRVLPQLENWETEIGAAQTAQITGLPLAPAAGVLRPLWLRQEHPDLFSRAKIWLNLPDYAAFRLCGVKATEYSLAARMMVLDLASRQWSRELLEQLEIEEAMFAELAPSGKKIGAIHRKAAELTGLPEGTPVCTGGHDHLCAAVGLGATGEGVLFDSIGTAEAVLTSLAAQKSDAAIAEAGIAQGIHVLNDKYYAISGNSFGGGSIDWARRIFKGSVDDRIDGYEALHAMASNAPMGSGGVFFLPHLRRANPPILDPLSRGAFVGLSGDSGPEHLARAVLEGLAFEYQRILDAVNENFELSSRRLVAAGGGTRNSLFMQIKADVAGIPINIPEVDEATCLGAALAAGVGAGVYDDYDHAQHHVKFSTKVIEPDATRHEFYQERYEQVFVHLYDQLKSVNHKISRWVNSET